MKYSAVILYDKKLFVVIELDNVAAPALWDKEKILKAYAEKYAIVYEDLDLVFLDMVPDPR